MANPMDMALGTVTGGFSIIGQYMWLVWVFLGLAVIGTIIYVISNFMKSQKKWDVTIRIRQEDNQYGRIYIDPIIVRGRRIVLSNGLRLIYLEKEILGKRLFPLLNYHTRPGVYDLIITSDNRIFIITGIDGVDEQRKILKVGIRYPGVDYSLDEVNRDHAKLNSLDRKSDLLGMVKAGAIAVVAIVILIIFIVGTQKYIELKRIDKDISQSELQLFESLERYQMSQNEQTNAMIILIDKLREVTGQQNLRNALSGSS